MKRLFPLVVILICFLTACSRPKALHDELYLSTLFSDNMVLQRDQKINLWGWGAANSKVDIFFLGQRFQTQVGADSKWKIQVGPFKAGGPFDMMVTNLDKRKVIRNILIGDIWFAGGQSNMDFKVQHLVEAEYLKQHADEYPQIKFYQAYGDPSEEMAEDLPNAAWRATSDWENFKNSSAVAYAFARAINDKYKIPVGIVQASWDSTKIEYWMSKELLKPFKEFDETFKHFEIPYQNIFTTEFPAHENLTKGSLHIEIGDPKIPNTLWLNGIKIPPEFRNEIPAEMNLIKTENNQINIRLRSNSVNKKQLKKFEDHLIKNSFIGIWDTKEAMHINKWAYYKINEQEYPTVLYNGVLNPILDFSMRGAIWYQGENNQDKPELYKKLFTSFVNHFREKQNNQSFPFYSVQLASYVNEDFHENKDLGRFRDAQRRLTKAIPYHAMATSIDKPDQDYYIHPHDKEPIGQRLALLARKYHYGEKNLIAGGPNYVSHETIGSKIKVNFEDIGSGLIYKPVGQFSSFEIAANDGEFKAAKAYLEGNAVIVSNDTILNPVKVRYAYRGKALATLFNREGLPAPSFVGD